MSDELKAAVDISDKCNGLLRYIAKITGEAKFAAANAGTQAALRDTEQVCLYLKQHLDAQAALDAERAKPIDEAWLRSIGFEQSDYCLRIHGPGDAKYMIEVFSNSAKQIIRFVNAHWKYTTIGHVPTTNRGMMLDLLAALKVEVRG